ncbi:unnamed protein product, partial [Oppiella nova]
MSTKFKTTQCNRQCSDITKLSNMGFIIGYTDTDKSQHYVSFRYDSNGQTLLPVLNDTDMPFHMKTTGVISDDGIWVPGEQTLYMNSLFDWSRRWTRYRPKRVEYFLGTKIVGLFEVHKEVYAMTANNEVEKYDRMFGTKNKRASEPRLALVLGDRNVHRIYDNKAHSKCLSSATPYSALKGIGSVDWVGLGGGRCGRSHYYGSAHRILGGRVAQTGEFPWIVSLHRSGQFKCAGSIINANTVLTAAHCVSGVMASDVTIRYNTLFNSYKGFKRNVTKLIIHPKYNNQTIDNDIAIVRLSKNLVLGLCNSGSICLPSKSDNISPGDVLTVMGWGLIDTSKSSPILMVVDIPMISLKMCRKQYKYLPKVFKITENMICAGFTSGGQDACSGDSGGPLVKSFDGNVFVLMGIVSKGFGCGLPDKAGVYTKVSNYVDWINANL